MAPNAILGLLATLLLFSGCLDASSPPATPPEGATPEARAPDASDPSVPEPLADCPEGGQNNYGTWTQVGDEYVVSPYGGDLVIYYRESNGCRGLQTEGDWAHNPDTKVAEVPSPLAGAPPAKA